MKVLTPDGYIELTNDHVGKVITVKNINGKWTQAKVQLSQNDDSVWKITFDTGNSILVKRNQRMPVVYRNFDDVDTKILKNISFVYAYNIGEGSKIPKSNFQENGKISEWTTVIEVKRNETKDPVFRLNVKDRANCYHIEDAIIGG